MKKVETGIEGLYILEPKIFGDSRGYFLESYNSETFKALGLNYSFVQDNESLSKFGTIRGLHFQRDEHAQAKLVRVILGEVLDVVVDVRKGSKTFGKHLAVNISESNKRMLIIPRGFAHGFSVLSESAIFSYKCDNLYAPQAEEGILFDDQDLAIDWQIPKGKATVSDKDLKNKKFKEIFS